MKIREKILYLVLGMTISLLLSATVMNDFITVKPATPKYTVSYTGTNPSMFTRKYAKEGFIVTSSASQGYYNTFVVMVKY